VPTKHGWARQKLSPAVGTLERLFGSYSAAIAACGFEPPAAVVVQTFTREEIVAALQQHAAEHGAAPTAHDWKLRADGRPTQDQVAAAFGSWSAALEATGFAVPRNGHTRPVLAEREPKAGEERQQATPPAAEREPVSSAAAVSGPVSPATVGTDEPASRSANTASIEGRKQEAGVLSVNVAINLEALRAERDRLYDISTQAAEKADALEAIIHGLEALA
jgi:hypothetical protein